MARLRARAACISIAAAALAIIGCGGDDSEEEPPPMNNAECTSGVVRTCYDSARNCSGRSVCRNGIEGDCICDPETINDGSIGNPDGSVVMNDGSVVMNDGSVVMNDADVVDDGSMPEPDAMPPDGECSGSCVPPVPDDFEGPFLTFIGGNDPPSCGGAYDDEGPTGGAGLIAPDANCSECTCDSSSNSCATYVNLEAGGNSSCAGGCPTAFSQACGEIDIGCLADNATSTSVRAVVPASAGSCSPSAQDPDIDTAEFAQLAHTCAPSAELDGDGCDGSELCAPDGPFDGLYCVSREGEHDCPSGPYSDRHVFYGDIDDTRGCSECACDRNCDYSVTLFQDDNMTCMGAASATLSIDSPNESEEASSCETAPVGTGGTLRAAFSVTGNGACAASGGEPEGSATGDQPITFCCLE